ncbi:MAG: putative Multicopper oxidase [Frankiales bacterium]|nr:putative Multicopper oxidase [Frankiales bacterium]
MTDDFISTATIGLIDVGRPSVVQLADGDRYALSIGPVRKQLDDGAGADLRMLAYNESIPGPTLRVPQGARITVDVAAVRAGGAVQP